MTENDNSIKLYSYWRSSASWRVRLALNLKNIKYDLVPVNLLKGEQLLGDYLKLNPNGLIPSLIFPDGHVCTQSQSICELLEEMYPQVPLVHGDKFNKAKVLSPNYRSVNFLASLRNHLHLTVFLDAVIKSY